MKTLEMESRTGMGRGQLRALRESVWTESLIEQRLFW